MRGGPGGPGGMMNQKTNLVSQFDKDKDGFLNTEERKAARKAVASGAGGGRRGGPGGMRGGPGGMRGGRGGNQTAAAIKPNSKLTPAEVKSYPGVPLYDLKTLRTIFLEFEDADWEKELADFKSTDVDVPAKVTVDGKIYPDVGVHFHGNTSYMMVGEGQKRSLILDFEAVHPKQNLEGYHKLNLLNSHEDASFLHSVLSLQIARDYIPAPKANFMRVVINGETWGVYVNQQHFSKEFAKDWFGSGQGARWKIPGSPGGRGGLEYLGEDAAPYKRIYEIKSPDGAEPWKDLIKLTKVLNQTPLDQLEQALTPILDIDGALRYFAWDNVMANGDGFYSRASDYDLYEDKTGRFHAVPYDSNECFSSGGGPGGPGGRGGRGGGMGPRGDFGGFGGAPMGGPGAGPDAAMNAAPAGGRGSAANTAAGNNAPGGRGGRGNFGGRGGFGGGRGGGPGGGGPGGGGALLDPLVSAGNTNNPFLSRLLAVPSLRKRYLGYVRDIAEKWLDWSRLGPLAEQYHNLIAADMETDNRKTESTEDFESSVSGGAAKQASAAEFGGGGGGGSSLKDFADKRRQFLLNYKPAVTTAAN